MNKVEGSFRSLLRGKGFIEGFSDHLLLYFTFFMLLCHYITDYAAYFINFVYYLPPPKCKFLVVGFMSHLFTALSSLYSRGPSI